MKSKLLLPMVCCMAALLNGCGKNYDNQLEEAKMEFERSLENFDLYANKFEFLKSDTFGISESVFYWKSIERPEAKIVVSVNDYSVRVTGIPLIPNCRIERIKVEMAFGAVCRTNSGSSVN